MQKSDGSWTSSDEEIGAKIAEYYKHLFTFSCRGNVENILEGIPNSITDQMNQELTKPMMEEEIRIALFSMDPNKAPGLDGMSHIFFQKFRHIIKLEVVNAVQSFFNPNSCSKL